MPQLSSLRYLWAGPASLVGLVVAAVALALGARFRRVAGTLEIGGGGLGALIKRTPGLRRFHAITLGHVILGVDQCQLDACRAHERVHVAQYERWGLLFFPLYLGSSLVQLLRGGNPYLDNCFERQAREQSTPTSSPGTGRAASS